MNAQDAAARIALDVEDALGDVAADAATRGFRLGVLHALDELSRCAGVDEIAGVGALTDTARRLRRENS